MTRYHFMETIAKLAILSVLVQASVVATQPRQAEIVYQWRSLDYAWPNDTVKQDFIADKRFIVENNIITGIKVLDGSVYVSVPRWKPGVPSTLNKLKTNPINSEDTILEPYPNWEMQTLGKCGALQYVQSMEIDPNTGHMWIIDTGRINILTPHSQNLCPAKLVIYDIRNNQIIHVYEFPDNVVSRTTNFMNDIVIDYVNGVASFAYITDTYDAKLYVYDVKKDTSYFFKHSSMEFEPGTETIHVGQNYMITTANIDGISISFDFRFLYFCAMNGYSLYRVSTAQLRNQSAVFSAERIGRKTYLTDGMVFTDRALYFGGLTTNSVYKWPTNPNNQRAFNQQLVISNKTSLRWVDTFAIDSQNLWLVANGLDGYVIERKNLTQANIFVWRIPIGENGYLSTAASRTKDDISNGNMNQMTLTLIVISVLVILAMSYIP
ncbi:protein yellow-like [Argopecten irradians]|uniref:protein yellow-like n=1 Tax=Argopecten irradians TaxID=31199 RepID=UPI00370FA045